MSGNAVIGKKKMKRKASKNQDPAPDLSERLQSRDSDDIIIPYNRIEGQKVSDGIIREITRFRGGGRLMLVARRSVLILTGVLHPKKPEIINGEGEGAKPEEVATILAAETGDREWIKEYFTESRLPHILGETPGMYLLRQTKKLCRVFGIGARAGNVDRQSVGCAVDPDLSSALLLTSAAALWGTLRPLAVFSFFVINGSPRMRLLLSAEKGRADTVYFTGIRRFAEKAGIYFVMLPHPRGFLVEMCVARPDLSLLGLKSDAGFSGGDVRR